MIDEILRSALDAPRKQRHTVTPDLYPRYAKLTVRYEATVRIAAINEWL